MYIYIYTYIFIYLRICVFLICISLSYIFSYARFPSLSLSHSSLSVAGPLSRSCSLLLSLCISRELAPRCHGPQQQGRQAGANASGT